MNKKEMIDALAAKAGCSKKQAGDVYEAFVEVVGETLKKGEKVQLVGFGTFEAKTREARTGINPKTKESIAIPATTVPAFKAGKALKDSVK